MQAAAASSSNSGGASASTSDLNASIKLETSPTNPPVSDVPQAEPSSGVHRTQSSVASGVHREADNLLKQRPEKRKRSRVTPEQLPILEQEFAKNRTPTGAQRKAISERLGMRERQTQIWFQNRRAKAKILEARPSTPDHAKSNPSGVHLESYIAQLIREKEPVTLIPCSDLKIGHWTRINPSTLHHEVLAYTSQTRQCITWFIRSSGLSFKIEVPFSSISSARLIDVKAPQLVTLVLELHTIPLFFVQQPDVRPRSGETMNDVRRRIGIAPHLPLPSIGATPGEWVASNDWTQNQQASRVLRHELTGPRTSIIPGVRGFPKEFGLLPDDMSPLSHAESTGGIDPSFSFGEPMPPYERDSVSPSSWWNDTHQLASAHTPSSYSGYESSSTHGSQYSAHSSQLSLSSLASGSQSAHTPASSTRATPAAPDIGDLNLGQDLSSNIAQPVPLRPNVHGIPFSSDAQRAQSLSTLQSQHDSLLLAASNPTSLDLGFGPFDLQDPSQGLLPQQTMGSTSHGLGQGFNLNQSQAQQLQSLFATGSAVPANTTEISPSDISLSHYAQQRQHESKLSEAALMAQNLGGQSNFIDFGMLSDLQDFNSFGNQDFSQLTSNGGAVNLGFEVDTSFGDAIHAHTQSVNAYPQSQPPHQAAFDESQLYLQQPGGDINFAALSGFTADNLAGGSTFGVNQYAATATAQPQLLSQGQGQRQSMEPNSSRRSSMYGHQ